MALRRLGCPHGEGLFQLAGGGAFAEGGGHGRRGEVPEMGGEGGEGGALPEGGCRSRQPCGGQREGGGGGGDSYDGLTGYSAGVSPGHVLGGSGALWLGGAGAGGSLRAGHEEYGLWNKEYDYGIGI